MEVHIRKVKQGDADTLAYIQTESWKAAFKGIIDDKMLEKCTNVVRQDLCIKGFWMRMRVMVIF